jgi:hypothetical protein
LLDGKLAGERVLFAGCACILTELSIQAPIEMYVMQGEHPLPGPVVDRFAKTSGDVGKNVFLLSQDFSSVERCRAYL